MESSVKYGQEIGLNLIKIGKKVAQNENLLMLLNNSDLEPLNKALHPEKLNWMDYVGPGKLIRFVPMVFSDEENTKSKIVLMINEGLITTNSDNENLELAIHIFCPFVEWAISGDNLRPFAIMAEIRKSLQDKRINGLGELKYLGFRMATLTEEMGSYVMRFSINAFS